MRDVNSTRAAGVGTRSRWLRFGPTRLALALAVAGCSSGESDRAAPRDQGPASVESRVEAIQTEADRIDAAVDAAEVAGRLLTREYSHWQFSGLLDGSTPRFLSARLTQGRVVREENYYFADGGLRLVRVDKWWDVDEPDQAPEPPTRRYFHVENDRVIRLTHEVTSSAPVTQTTDLDEPAATFIARSRSISGILFRTGGDSATVQSLELFPEAERVKP